MTQFLIGFIHIKPLERPCYTRYERTFEREWARPRSRWEGLRRAGNATLLASRRWGRFRGEQHRKAVRLVPLHLYLHQQLRDASRWRYVEHNIQHPTFPDVFANGVSSIDLSIHTKNLIAAKFLQHILSQYGTRVDAEWARNQSGDAELSQHSGWC